MAMLHVIYILNGHMHYAHIRTTPITKEINDDATPLGTDPLPSKFVCASELSLPVPVALSPNIIIPKHNEIRLQKAMHLQISSDTQLKNSVRPGNRLVKVSDQIVDIFQTNRQTDEIVAHARRVVIIGRHLTVRHLRRVDNQ